LANVELQSDLKDLLSLTGTRIGLVDPRSTDQIRDQVIEHAAQHGISLEPEQVDVERNGEGKDEISVSTAYDTNMNVRLSQDHSFHRRQPWKLEFRASGMPWATNGRGERHRKDRFPHLLAVPER
jgi:hypothetical protein